MGKVAILLAVLLFMVFGMAVAGAVTTGDNVYTFTPIPGDLGDLTHQDYYSWGINFTVPQGETITDVVLTVNNVDNWQQETNDHLYIHLLNNPRLGVRTYTDWEGGGDNWASSGPLVANYHDAHAGTPETLTYSLKDLGLLDDFETYVADGRVGFGFDPDCHYYNTGISLKIYTTSEKTPPGSVPEPGSMALLLTGAAPVAGMVIRRRVKK
jgi:hypothetical protein